MKALVPLAVGALACASACGAAGGLMTTNDVLAALRGAGFTDLGVRSYAQAGSDWIYTRGIPVSRVEEMPIQALRFSSIAAAQKRLANDQPLLQGRLSASDRAILPKDFRRTRLTEVRVCNVVISSYNARSDSGLSRRLEHLLAALRAKC